MYWNFVEIPTKMRVFEAIEQTLREPNLNLADYAIQNYFQSIPQSGVYQSTIESRQSTVI